MDSRTLVILFILIFNIFNAINALVDPFTWTALAATAVGLTGIGYAGFSSYFYCKYNECCSEKWIKPEIESLARDLDDKLIGQHLVKDTIIKSVRAHVKNRNSNKPLVISLHGWTGGGKTFVTQIIARNLYREGAKSRFFHFFSALNHFPHAYKVIEYQDNLRRWIKGNVSECPNSVFVFDEVDKLPPGLFDGIKPYMDHHEQVDRVDFRRCIFILLSNTGGKDITNIAFDFWKRGKKREEIELKDVSHAISLDAMNTDGGFQDSELIVKYLIDHYIPFLPMERSHVKLCIINEYFRRGLAPTDVDINRIADQLQYYPPDLKLFSTSGCKKIEKLVDISLE